MPSFRYREPRKEPIGLFNLVHNVRYSGYFGMDSYSAFQYSCKWFMLILLCFLVYRRPSGLQLWYVMNDHSDFLMTEYSIWFNIQMVQSKDMVRDWIPRNTLSPTQNGRHFTGDNIKFIFVNENGSISIQICLKCLSYGPINNKLSLVHTLVQTTAWWHAIV